MSMTTKIVVSGPRGSGKTFTIVNVLIPGLIGRGYNYVRQDRSGYKTLVDYRDGVRPVEILEIEEY